MSESKNIGIQIGHENSAKHIRDVSDAIVQIISECDGLDGQTIRTAIRALRAMCEIKNVTIRDCSLTIGQTEHKAELDPTEAEELEELTDDDFE